MFTRKTITGLASGVAVFMMACAQAAVPPQQRTVAQWSPQERVVSAESGSRYPGPWDNDRVPYGVEIMEACSPSDPSRIVAILGSAQSAKSEFGLNTIGHTITDAPKGILVLLPSFEEAVKYAEIKLDTMIEASPALSRCVYRRYGDRRSKVTRKTFRNGFLQIGSANADKNLQMITVGLIICEELGGWTAETGERGDPFTQALARGTTYGEDLKVVCPSTPGMVGNCRITALYMAGDQRLWFWECPECGDYFTMRFSHLINDDGRIACAAPCCGSVIGHHHKAGMNAKGLWLPLFTSDNPENPVPFAKNDTGEIIPDVILAKDIEAARGRDTEGRDKSYRIWQGISPFSTWKLIWDAYEAAKDDPTKLAAFYQQVLGEAFEAAIDTPKHEKIHAMRGGAPNAKTRPVRRAILPPWAGFVTTAADLQGDRIEWASKAYGPNQMVATIDHGIIDRAPFDPAAWTELRRVFDTEYESTHLRPQRAVKMGVDTGGHNTQEAYHFILGNPDVHGIKGMTGPKARFEPLFQASRKGGKLKGLRKRTEQRVPLVLLNTHQLKKAVYFGLQNALNAYELGEVQPGLNFFYHDEIDTGFAKQLVAENLVIDERRRNEYWERIAGRANEQLDLEVYAYALALMYGFNRMTDADWTALFTREAIDPTEIDLTPLEKLARVKDEPVTPKSKKPIDTRPSWMQKMIEYPDNQS